MDFTTELENAYKAIDHHQGLSAWQIARLGKITGSNFHRVKRSSKGWSDGAESLLAEICFEWITKQPASMFSGSLATEWGNRWESVAIAEYQRRTGMEVNRGEFFLAPGFRGLVGCTPDGVGERGLEVKCPYGPKAHITTLTTRRVPDEYREQVYGHMLCAQRDMCDFVSYDPRIKNEKYNIVIIEVDGNDIFFADLKQRLIEFEAELITRLERLEIDWTKGLQL